MTIGVSEKKFVMTLDEIKESIEGRQTAAHMQHTPGKDNPLIDAWNAGVDCMAKYMRDWFDYQLLDAQDYYIKEGGKQ